MAKMGPFTLADKIKYDKIKPADKFKSDSDVNGLQDGLTRRKKKKPY